MITTVIDLGCLWNTETRIGVLSTCVAKSRTESVAAFSFGFCQSMAARWGSRKAHRFVFHTGTGTPILSGCRLDWRRGGSCNPTYPKEHLLCLYSIQKSSLFARNCSSLFQSSRWALSQMSKIFQTLSVLRASFCPKKHNQLGMTRHAQTGVAL